MTHFEFISVAVALIYSLAVGRLLKGLSPALDAHRRYWIQLAWIFQILSLAAISWWGFWTARHYEWTPIRFIWALAMPSLQYLRAATIVSDQPASIESFREHFYAIRERFFSISLMVNVTAFLLPWAWALLGSLLNVGTYWLLPIS